MRVFKVSVFEKDGIIDSSQFVAKMPRGTLHPHVAASLIAEANDLMHVVGEELGTAFNYKKGKKYHIWILTGNQVQYLSKHLVKFSDSDLKEHCTKLQTLFAPAEPPSVASSESIEDGEDSEDSEKN